jgi:hypothetical protein
VIVLVKKSFVTEQTAAKLLLDEFTPQQCRTMFPRYITVDMAERSRILEAAFKAARDLPPLQKEAELRRLNVELQKLLNAVEDGHSLSMDGMIEHEASGEVVWYDASAIHTTAHSNFDAELSLTRRRMAAGKEGSKVQSEALLVAHNEKRTRYSLLNAIVERQVARECDVPRPSTSLSSPRLTESSARMPFGSPSGLCTSTVHAFFSKGTGTMVRLSRTLLPPLDANSDSRLQWPWHVVMPRCCDRLAYRTRTSRMQRLAAGSADGSSNRRRARSTAVTPSLTHFRSSQALTSP